MPDNVPIALREVLLQNIAANCSSELQFKDEKGNDLLNPLVIGSHTEGAFLFLAHDWCIDLVSLKETTFDQAAGIHEYPFTSARMRSASIVHLKDNKGLRFYCFGAGELILSYCVSVLVSDGTMYSIDECLRTEMSQNLANMAGRALRPICLAHKVSSSNTKLVLYGNSNLTFDGGGAQPIRHTS